MSSIQNNRFPPPPRDPRADKLRRAKQLYTDYFTEFRRGLGHSYNRDRREHIIDNTVHPKLRRWGGLRDPFLAARGPRITRNPAIFPGPMPESPGLLAPAARAKLEEAYSTTFNLNRDFTPANVSFQKILGHGGFGVAALFALYDLTGREFRLVVKADIRRDGGDTITKERNNMILMAGAKHVVQRILLAAFPWPQDRPEPINYFLVSQRWAIKLFIFIFRVVWLLILFLVQAIMWLLANLLRLLQNENMAADANPDPANNQAPQPDPSQPVPAQPGSSQPDNPQDPRLGIGSLNILNLWPVLPWENAEPGIDGRIRLNRQRLDQRQDIIAMEFLKFGDLGTWIGKMVRLNSTQPRQLFSEKVAWIIFECLWRGCVALAHPKGFYQGKDPLTSQIPIMTESSRSSTVDDGNPMVHFDLDPQNSMTILFLFLCCWQASFSNNSFLLVFVGDFVSDHDLWPLTKVCDTPLKSPLILRHQTIDVRSNRHHR